MNGKVKEIFRSLFFASVNMKGIIIEVLEIMLSIGAIIIFSFSKKESWVYWLVFFLGIFLLVLDVYKRQGHNCAGPGLCGLDSDSGTDAGRGV